MEPKLHLEKLFKVLVVGSVALRVAQKSFAQVPAQSAGAAVGSPGRTSAGPSSTARTASPRSQALNESVGCWLSWTSEVTTEKLGVLGWSIANGDC